MIVILPKSVEVRYTIFVTSTFEIPIIVHNGPSYDFHPMIEYPAKTSIQVILSI